MNRPRICASILQDVAKEDSSTTFGGHPEIIAGWKVGATTILDVIKVTKDGGESSPAICLLGRYFYGTVWSQVAQIVMDTKKLILLIAHQLEGFHLIDGQSQQLR